MAEELNAYARLQIQPTTARDMAYTVVARVSEMVNEMRRAATDLSLLGEQQQAFQLGERLVESIMAFDWSTLGANYEALSLVFDQDFCALLVGRLLNGESVAFLYELLYERLALLERHGRDAFQSSVVSQSQLSALRLRNTRRHRPSDTLLAPRRVRNVPAELGGKF